MIPTDADGLDPATAISAKIVIAGGFGVGKTTLVRSISEVPPLNTEAWMTEASEGIDDLSMSGAKSTTTVAMDFGRISLFPDLVLYLFGTPGQPRFWFLWDDLSRGALGAVVLVDSRRLDQSFAALNYFENDSTVPYIVAVNRFEGKLWHDVDEVREALALRPDIPLVTCDARETASTAQVLRDLVVHTMSLAQVPEPRRTRTHA
ncbi:ATP/GTP-binding protein [Frankia sp. Mgl5]|uniref:ATP-binding protein n=1 Tax=Parafrankia soli TaxID=2599596 RepID=A0A1S1QR38_9ACTN|nr:MULTISPECIES: ATP/GTP-binding protein [Frankiaceae]MCK9930448.1 ATP/GTP-binding protein [Frankia sp. Mgl5]OHV35562.1 ATP-binding protein [Parafrankia soli]TCJ36664.1 ATP-binding protein [Parafrankia sp. BMG5.11]